MGAVDPEAMREYRESLDFCQQNRSEAAIPNRWPWQCKLAVRSLSIEALERQVEAKQKGGEQVTVRILTSTLPDYVYGGGTALRLSEFVHAGGRLRVLVWHKVLPRNSHPFFEALQASKEDFRLSGFDRAPTLLRHLMSVGHHAYRLEAPHDAFTADFSAFSPEVAASTCFNDPSMGRRIVDYFDAIWSALETPTTAS